jgi:hypothetical protein
MENKKYDYNNSTWEVSDTEIKKNGKVVYKYDEHSSPSKPISDLPPHIRKAAEKAIENSGGDPDAFGYLPGIDGLLLLIPDIADDYNSRVKVYVDKRREDARHTIKVALSTRGWGDYSPVEIAIDDRKSEQDWLSQARAALTGANDVDNPNQSDTEILALIRARIERRDNASGKKAAAKAKKEQAENAARNSIKSITYTPEKSKDEGGETVDWVTTVELHDGEKLTFIDRNIFDVGRVINPRYEIAPGIKGGMASKDEAGRQIWISFKGADGWQKVRDLTDNELVAIKAIGILGKYAGADLRMDTPDDCAYSVAETDDVVPADA